MISRDKILEIIETKRMLLVAILAGFLLILVLILIVALVSTDSEKKAREEMESSRRALRVPSELLFLPSEPVEIPGVILSREPRTQWSKEEVESYFIVPDAADLKRLRGVSADKVKKLLELIP